MYRIISYIAVFASVLVIFNAKVINLDRTIEISYYDLLPEAQKQVDCLADNIYFEARSEPVLGQKAVAFVTMNRVQSKMFPKTVCGVVRQQIKSTCQFSWWCEPHNKQHSITGVNNYTYEKIRLVALEVYLNYDHVEDITGGALFYHANYVHKSKIGVQHLKHTTTIGNHIFYRI